MSIREIITSVLNQRQSKSPKLERINSELATLYNQLSHLQQIAIHSTYQEDTFKEVSSISDISNHLNDTQKDTVQLNHCDKLRSFAPFPWKIFSPNLYLITPISSDDWVLSAASLKAWKKKME